ncbi:MAG: hypothetical protein HRT61_06420 [Ekhidna sp.]|nr:hypothetical protein [Ekhidna sp.]
MKSILTILILILVVPALASNTDLNGTEKDTVIIELNNKSKIVIVTKDRSDLASIQNYDINQMIRDLNAQLSDSVEYMEINDGKAYVNDEEQVEMKDWKINDDEVRIKLGGVEVDVDPDDVDDWDDDDWNDRRKVTYEAERIDRTTHHFNIDIGLNNWIEDGNFPDVNNADYSVKPWGSWYVGLNSMNRTWVGGPVFLEWGLGISWYNWKMQDTDVQILEGAEAIEFYNWNDDPTRNISGRKSKLTATYINATLVPMFDFSRGRRKVTSIESGGVKIKRYSRKGFRFGVGGYAGYRIGSHSKFKFKEDGDRERDKERDNFFLENFRYGIRAQVGWKGVELFASYDLNEVFSAGRGPIDANGNNASLNAVTFGITL